jgi:hypothetical protein
VNSIRIWTRACAEDLHELGRKFIRRRVRKLVELIMNDLDMVALLKPSDSSVAFENEKLRDVPRCKTRDELYRLALGHVASDNGLFLEFGVYKGASINRLAKLRPNVTFYGFDSFVGLPESWTPGAKKGAFSLKGRLPPVRANVKLVAGFFEDTLRQFLAAQRLSRISFMHVDSDLYSAARTILTETAQFMTVGTVIVFDELFNYPRWEQEEHKALSEFAAQTGMQFEYIGYIPTGSQVAIKITAAPSNIPRQ